MAPSGTPSDDQLLWQALREGDRDAFARLYQTHYRTLYGYGHKLVADAALVEDAIQDLFVDLWRLRNGLAPAVSVPYYLFRSLRRRLHRAREREDHLPLDPDRLSIPDGDCADEEDLIQQAERLIRQLPARQQEVVTLRFLGGFKNEEIADLLGITEKSVRNTLHKALSFLRRQVRTTDPLLGGLLVTAWVKALLAG